MPGWRLFFLFQIKACKERWDARCTRGAPRCRCAAAQDQIKMKITVWPHFMRWVQWPSKTMQSYWYPSWAACSQAPSPQFTQGLNVDKTSHWEDCIESTKKKKMHTEYQTQQHITAQWSRERTRDWRGKINVTWKGGRCQSAPKLSVHTCQLTLTTRHVQYVKKSTCAAGAAHTGVLHRDAEFQVGYHMFVQRERRYRN